MGDVALHPQRTFGNTKMVLVVTPGELLLASGEWRSAVLVHTLQDRTELPIRQSDLVHGVDRAETLYHRAGARHRVVSTCEK